MVNEFSDDRIELKQWLRNFTGFLITFNGNKYDLAVLAYCDMNNYWLGQSKEVFNQKIKAFSDLLINTDDELFVYKYMNYKLFKFTSIDLYLYWARLLRISKKISLKALGIQLNYPVVQELPYPPDIRSLTKEQIDEIHHYCSVHDLGILRLLCDQLEGSKTTVPLGDLGSIQLRAKIVKDFSINAWSMDAPKIASEALINSYCRITGKNKRDVSKLKFDRPTIKFKDLFSDTDFGFTTEPFISVYNQWMNSIDAFSKEFIIFSNGHGCKISVGIGGIHAINNNEIYEQREGYKIITSDVALKWGN